MPIPRRIWFSHYELRSQSPIGARMEGRRERYGALLRVEDEGVIGYADLHPWPELGDPPLDAQLRSLAAGRPLSLGERSLWLAELDRRARARGLSAFDGLARERFPSNHYLFGKLPDLVSLEKRLRHIDDSGFDTLKIKMDSDWRSGAQALNEASGLLKAFRLRLDFNGTLEGDDILSFCKMLHSNVREAIEFVEDPIALLTEPGAEWMRLEELSQVPFALDRLPHEAHGAGTKVQVGWRIWKPASQSRGLLSSWFDTESRFPRLCATSYLDHPVGQMGALLEVVQLIGADLPFGRVLGTCGLASHSSYEANEFSERLTMADSRLLPSAGTGVGFDDLLESQQWRELR